jgi:hypothetical protein
VYYYCIIIILLFYLIIAINAVSKSLYLTLTWADHYPENTDIHLVDLEARPSDHLNTDLIRVT